MLIKKEITKGFHYYCENCNKMVVLDIDMNLKIGLLNEDSTGIRINTYPGTNFDIRCINCYCPMEKIDEKIANCINEINNRGFVTHYSCEGHEYIDDIRPESSYDFYDSLPYITIDMGSALMRDIAIMRIEEHGNSIYGKEFMKHCKIETCDDGFVDGKFEEYQDKKRFIRIGFDNLDYKDFFDRLPNMLPYCDKTAAERLCRDWIAYNYEEILNKVGDKKFVGINNRKIVGVGNSCAEVVNNTPKEYKHPNSIVPTIYFIRNEIQLIKIVVEDGRYDLL